MNTLTEVFLVTNQIRDPLSVRNANKSVKGALLLRHLREQDQSSLSRTINSEAFWQLFNISDFIETFLNIAKDLQGRSKDFLT